MINLFNINFDENENFDAFETKFMELYELIKDEDLVKEVAVTPSESASPSENSANSESSDTPSAKPSTEIIDPFKTRTAEVDTCGSLR